MPAAVAQGAGITTIPSPIGGVNFYSSLFGMPPEDAIRLTNWWPQVYGCMHRRGFVEWKKGYPGLIGSLYAYHTNMGQSFLYAFAGTGMYNVTLKDTSPTPPAPTAVITGLTTTIWQGTMMANIGGTHKILVSGQDNPIWIHQTTLGQDPPTYSRLTAGDGVASGTIKADPDLGISIDPRNFIDVTIHQKRLWFVEKNSTNGWFLDADVNYGIAYKFDFGPLFKRGGFLQSLATWTVDTGEGANDVLVAFGSEGDIAVYKGIDPLGAPLATPAVAPDWTLQGVYYAGTLLDGHRFHCKVSGDLKFLTIQGLISMNDMLTSTSVGAPQSSIEAQNVQQFLADQTSQYGFLPGWDMKFVASQNMLIINIPSASSTGALQLVENVVNKKWSTFLGMDATCWVADFNEAPYYGSNARILQAWTGNSDNVTLSSPLGVPITALVQQAYNYFGTPANNKQVGLYRPNFLTSRSVTWKGSIRYDFNFFTPVLQVNPPGPNLPYWDSAIWDSAKWAGGLHAQKDWASAEGLGFAGSLAMATRSDGEVVWVSTDITVTSGGIL